MNKMNRNGIFLALTFLLVILSCNSTTPSEQAKKLTDSKAPGNCICPMMYDPVCTPNNQQFSNSCEANCNGVKEYSHGECKK